MIYTISQEFSFDAAHTLNRNVPLVAYGPSRQMHGHTYFARISVSGIPGDSGMIEFTKAKKPSVLDLFYMKEEAERIKAKLDHICLDDVEGLANPTLENLCTFISNQSNLELSSVEVWRHDGGKCVLIKEQTK